MKIEKKVIANLEKCYSIAPLEYQGKKHFLVAAEKQDPCYLFDEDGNLEDTVWEGPGGVMTMVQVPGTDGQFLATQKFYSPNDSKEAKIVIVTPKGKGNWEVRTLTDLPFVHRFDILTRDGEMYLIACALKSGHEYKDDWSMPGKVYVAKLPKDLSGFDEEHQLELNVLKEGLLKNHGYCHIREDGVEKSLVCAQQGVFLITPPASQTDWEIEQLLDEPASDAVLVDLDGDGEKELGVLSPFHGENIFIYKKKDGCFERIYTYEKKAEFTHAIYGGELCGEPAFVVGHRKGERNLLAFTYDFEKKDYAVQVLDEDCGPANVYHFIKDGCDYLVSANREINEIAMYRIF